ncbi:MAG: acetylglutamate kinase [Agriterribacter sp.]
MNTQFANKQFYSPLTDENEKQNMFYGANSLIFERAKALRNRMTPSEELLWRNIHINEWKVKFRRQHPIAIYIADFYCHSLKLVIELDGGIHEDEQVKMKDKIREEHLRSLGLHVIRFKNEYIIQNLGTTLATISKTIDAIKSEQAKKEKPALFVVKIGGNIINDEAKLSAFLQSFAQLAAAENNGLTNPPSGDRGFVLVHGGGKLATRLAEKMGVEQQMVDGRRITDAETLKIVTMVYAGYINKNIVAQLQANGCNAIGLSGADGNAILAHKRISKNNIDYGFAGDVDAVNADFLQQLLQQKTTIVLAPITHDKNGQLLNTNADTIAQETAKALSKHYDVSLIYSFEKSGVLLDADNDETVISKINPAYYAQLKDERKIFAGMIPKLDNAFAALNSGVKKVIIGKAEVLYSLMNGTAGTTIVNE